jgi:hypothetical protein
VRLRRPQVLIAALVLAQFGGCGGASSSAPAPVGVAAMAPLTALAIYPSASAADGNRLFIMVRAVGSVPVSMPLAFDTGSAGITLYAPDIFPASVVGAGGFSFAAGQTSISYQGITVTKQAGSRKFGSMSSGKTQLGNIGFAQVTFGDGAGGLQTEVMPVLLYYRITDNATGQSVAPAPQRGWFGVNAAPNLITVAGSEEPVAGYPPCAASTLGSCYVISVFKYLLYGEGVNAGFLLRPSPLQNCDITIEGDCSASDTLFVGLDQASETGFNSVMLECPPSGYVGAGTIEGYSVCQSGIANSTVTVSGTASGVVGATVLFDSGTPLMVLNIPTGSAFPSSVSAGSSVMVETPSGFTYSYTAGAGSEATQTTVVTGSSAQSIVGVGYFTSNSFFIDYTSAAEGWK